MNISSQEQIEQIRAAMAAQESLRSTLGDVVVEVTLAALREKLIALQAHEGLAEQRKQVAVLFADISGFTAISATMDSEDVAAIMNTVWQRLDAVIDAHGGWIDKHIGDAVMALFGVPIAREDDNERAIRAGLEMQAALAALRREKQVGLEMRIAVHAGPVKLGEVGSKAEYTAMGDTVNTASYLQHAAPVGQVLVSKSTYHPVRGLFDIQPVEPVAIKGKAKKMPACIVVGVRQRLFRVPTRGVEGVETRMVGRQAELALLQEAYQEVLLGKQARRVMVAGEAGIGKSRLLEEFSTGLKSAECAVNLYQARVDPQASHLPYALLRDLLAYRFDILASEAPISARATLEAGIMQVLGEGSQEKAHFIGHLIGLDFSASPFLRGILEDARQIRDRAVHYLAQFITADAQTRPVVIFVDDLHWGDEGSLALLESLLSQCQSAPLLLVALARPELFESHPEWGERTEKSLRLDLQLLSALDTASLVEQILGRVESIPPELATLIFQGSEGNPFYIEELLKMLVEDGAIQHDAAGWRVAVQDLSAIHVPQTLVGVLQARMDRLAAVELQVLQRAAVIGQAFWQGAVEQMQPAGDAQLEAAAMAEAFSNLQKKEMILLHPDSVFRGESEFIFKHALLHHVAYESILKRQRGSLHAHAAAWLVVHSGERAGEYAGLIALHYERAQDDIQAGEWYYRAGKQAQNTFAIKMAVDAYQKALALLPETPACFSRRIACYEGLARMLFWQTRHSSAVEAYQAMLREAQAAGDAAAQARALKALATVMDGHGEYRASLDYATRAVEVARAADALPELSDALMWQGWAQHRFGEMQQAIALGEQSLELAAHLNLPHLLATSLMLLGVAHGRVGNFAHAIQYMEESLTHLRQMGDRARQASALNNLSDVYSQIGEKEKGLALLQEALAIAREIGSRSREIVYLGNLGIAHVGVQMFVQAEPELCQAIALSEEAEVKFPDLYCSLVRACLGQHKTTTCQGESILAVAQRGLDLAQELGDPAGIADAWSALGCALAAVPSNAMHPSPANCFTEALRSLPEEGADRERACHLRDWARYELVHGDAAKGKEMWQQAIQLFTRLGLAAEIQSMRDSAPPGAL